MISKRSAQRSAGAPACDVLVLGSRGWVGTGEERGAPEEAETDAHTAGPRGLAAEEQAGSWRAGGRRYLPKPWLAC